jgi:preprotein translocase subunit YajC
LWEWKKAFFELYYEHHLNTHPNERPEDSVLADLFLMAPPAGGGGQTANPLLSFLPLLLIIVIMYFLLLRPQAKRQKEHKVMMDSLQKGDRVVTIGGVVGTIAGFDEKENIIVLKVADNVKIDITRSAVAQVLKKA